MTYGISDLQILLEDPQTGKLFRGYPEKKLTRLFHDDFLKEQQQVEVIDWPPEDEELKKKEKEINEKIFSDIKENLFKMQDCHSLRPKRGTNGQLLIVLPKTTPLIAPLLSSGVPGSENSPSSETSKTKGKDRKIDPRMLTVLLLGTDRKNEYQEPVAFSRFFKQWLIRKGVKEENIHQENYLKDNENLEKESSEINPQVAERIRQSIWNFYKPNTNSQLFVCDTGGIPKVRELIKELAFLLAGDRVQILKKTERELVGPVQTPSPIDVVRVRRECLQQVRRGALLDASAIASAFSPKLNPIDSQAESWVKRLRLAAQLINGNPSTKERGFPAFNALLEHIKKASCLLVAIRVETALLTGHWLEAINGSLTFLDVAYRDAIKEWAERNSSKYSIKYNIEKDFIEFTESTPEYIKEYSTKFREIEKNENLETTPNGIKVRVGGIKYLNLWDDLFNKQELSDFKIQELSYLKDLFYNYSDKNRNLAQYRNINTHALLKQKEIEEAVRDFKKAKIWGEKVNAKLDPENPPVPGECFLGRDPIKKVIKKFLKNSVKPPGTLYRDLLEELEDSLINSPLSN
ncbi:hypothetical protein [Candidatus Methylacidiphilum infernorum]|uniref:hypothetical protein n=1 Tax=Candidatus Methylacidiphilum infernorum TaxID=511746 RepID=UPI0011D12334|nr:hypothetical protein [Candidatus Methylacidiphilum infernorum]